MGQPQYMRCIMILSNHVRRVFQRRTDTNGTKLRILYYILQNYTEHEIYQKDLQSEFGIQRSTVSSLLTKLQNDGFIIREKVYKDDRLNKITPTAKAMRLSERLCVEINNFDAKIQNGIDQKDLEKWLEVSQKMIENLRKEDHSLC